MQRGHLVAYDTNGKPWFLSCEASGDVLPHDLPVGELKVIELPYGALEGVLTWHMENDKVVIDELVKREATAQELAEENTELKMMLLQAEGVI